jgi:hypothetical protein
VWRAGRALSIGAVTAAALALGGCVAPYYGTVKVSTTWDADGNLPSPSHRTGSSTATYKIDQGGLRAKVDASYSEEIDWLNGNTVNGCTFYHVHDYGTGSTVGTIELTEAPDASTARVSLNTTPPRSWFDPLTYPLTQDTAPCGSTFGGVSVSFPTRFDDGDPDTFETPPETIDSGRQPDGSWVGSRVYNCGNSTFRASCLVEYDLHPQTEAPASVK